MVQETKSITIETKNSPNHNKIVPNAPTHIGHRKTAEYHPQFQRTIHKNLSPLEIEQRSRTAAPGIEQEGGGG